jgi:TetR/AcrR family transcriptional regulator, lmrAB and yxaGH operons repressor
MSNDLNHQASLLNQAVKLFQQQGYHGTGLTQLLQTSGAPKGSFYHHFPRGKEQLAAAAVTQAAAEVANFASQSIEKSATAAQAVQLFSARLANWFEASGYRAGCPVTAVLLDTAPDGKLAAAACHAAFQRWITVWEDCFANAGIARHAASELAQLWVAALEGAWILSRAQQSTGAFLLAGSLFAQLVAQAATSATASQKFG